jgi:hypothetical protein
MCVCSVSLGAPPKLKFEGVEAREKLTAAYQARNKFKVEKANQLRSSVIDKVRLLPIYDCIHCQYLTLFTTNV